MGMAWMLGMISGAMSLLVWRDLLSGLSAFYFLLGGSACQVIGAGVIACVKQLRKVDAQVDPNAVRRETAILRWLAYFVMGLLAGFAYAHWRADLSFSDMIKERRDGEVAQVYATVTRSDCHAKTPIASPPNFSRRSCKLDLLLERANSLATGKAIFARSATIRVSYYGKTPIPAGSSLLADVKLRAPRSLANPGSFDARRYYLASGLAARGYIKTLHQLNTTASGFSAALAQLRYRLVTRLQGQTGHLESHGILMALLVGEKQQLKAQERELFTRTGTAHLLAISGLHVGIAAGIGFVIANFLIRLRPGLTLRYPRVVWQAILAIPLASVYAFLAGFALPTQRALLMLSVLMLCRCLHHKTTALNILAFALFSVVLFNPLSVLDGGFWFSFGAVAILILCWEKPRPNNQHTAEGKTSNHLRRPLQQLSGYFGSLVKMQWALLVAMPLFLLPFGLQSPVIAPLANAIAVPLISVLVVPLLFLALALMPVVEVLSAAVFALVDYVLALLKSLLINLDALSAGNFGNHVLQGVHAIQWLIFAYLCYVLVRAHSRRVLVLAVFLWLIIMLPLPESLRSLDRDTSPELSITQLDVGQGTAVLLTIGSSHWLYDTGAKYSDHFDMGSAVVLPYLLSTGIRELDSVVLSHGDNDHIGGFSSLRDQVPIDKLILAGDPASWRASYPALTTTDRHSALSCQRGQQWQQGSFAIVSLWPPVGIGAPSDNDKSCVLRISDVRLNGELDKQQGLLMLPGDISRSTERSLVDVYGEKLNSDVLILAHHGSHSSSSPAWLAAVKPKWAMVSAGFNNRYGHPGQRVQQRLNDSSIPLLQSSELGAIQFRYNRGEWSGPYCARYYGSHFWQQWDNRDVCIGDLSL